LTWQEAVQRLKNMPREKDSEILSHLTGVFRDELKLNGEIKALDKFWQEVKVLHEHGPLTKEMEKILVDASKGKIKAAAVMVRANPIVIHLPFIAKVLRYVVSQHKYLDAKGEILKDVKYLWNEFLPARHGGSITYNAEDLKKLVELVKMQKKLNREDAIPVVAEALNISEGYIKGKIRIKGGKREKPKTQKD
jgi:hypothetical protein